MRHPGRASVLSLMGLVAAVALVLSFDSIPNGRACGKFLLQVELKLPPGRKVVAVMAESVADLAFAEDLALDSNGYEPDREAQTWVAEQPIPVQVPCGTRLSSLFGRPLSRWQYRGLLLRLDHADGTTQWLAREIPDRMVTRSLVVVVP